MSPHRDGLAGEGRGQRTVGAVARADREAVLARRRQGGKRAVQRTGVVRQDRGDGGKPPGLDTSIPPSRRLVQPRPMCAPAVPCRPTSRRTGSVQPYFLTPSAVPFYHISPASRKYQPEARAKGTLPRNQRNASFSTKEYFLDTKGTLPLVQRNASFDANERFLW